MSNENELRQGSQVRIIYVAGAYRSPTHWGIVLNVRAAEAVALQVWQTGCVAYCPHLNTANFQGALPDEVWAAGHMAMLERCDAVILVPGHEHSAGTHAEIVRALDLGKLVFTSIYGLKEWLAREGKNP